MRRLLVALTVLVLLAGAASGAGSSAPPTARTAPLASSAQAEEQVAWSPTGTWIAFPNAYGPSRGLTIVRADGRGEWFVGSSVGAGFAAWSPDGGNIAWNALTPSWNLVVGRLADSSVRRVEADAGPSFSWAPDGTRLAYLRRKPGFHPALPPFSAMVFDLRRRPAREVAPAPLTEPHWAPDGGEIAFTRHERPGYGCLSSVRAVAVSGGAERSVAGGPFEVSEARWSPAGDRLAYVVSCARAGEQGLHVVGRDGSAFRRLDGRWWSHVAWSPDGTLIAGIVLGVPRRLVVREVDGPGVWEYGRYPSTFTWSPDSRRLLLSTSPEVVSIAEVGGTEKVLLSGFAADWSPDGRRIAFVRRAYVKETRFRTCVLHLWVADADGSDPRPLSRCRVHGTNGADRIWGTVGPDDIDGFGGADLIGAGRGADLVRARDGTPDRISCGAARDVALVDRRDRVSRDCEVVRRR